MGVDAAIAAIATGLSVSTATAATIFAITSFPEELDVEPIAFKRQPPATSKGQIDGGWSTKIAFTDRGNSRALVHEEHE